MIHPKTELKYISDEVGYGVFATEDIPEGSITYVKDSLEIVVSQTEFHQHSPEVKDVIEKYSYIDEKGNRIISWDFAKYVNHCCDCNTMSTGYGFEIAIRDIKKGDQITDEYGLFNIEHEMSLICAKDCCRNKITSNDFDTHYKAWDEKIKGSIRKLFEVDQPLLPFVDSNTKMELDILGSNPDTYKSVLALKYTKSKYLNGKKSVFMKAS
ncbi:MAG: SET domain-containing protein [Cyclobacteriaceae bacterium]|nr:SET domain-containing protein [Cyclobacteriaceae bacterium]